MPASTFYVPVIVEGQTPTADTDGYAVVLVDYTDPDGSGGPPGVPTEGQLWPRGNP